MDGFKTLTLSILLVSVSGLHVKYRDCGSAGTINYVDIEPCKAEPCSLVKGTSANITISFSPSEPSQTLANSVHGIISGVPVPFPLPNPDGCKNSGVKCPVVAKTTYIYHTSIDVKTIYPSLSLAIQWEMTDDQKKKVICFDIPAQIV